MLLSAQEYSSWYNQPTCNQDSQELIVLHMQDRLKLQLRNKPIVLKFNQYLTMKTDAHKWGSEQALVSYVIITPDIKYYHPDTHIPQRYTCTVKVQHHALVCKDANCINL